MECAYLSVNRENGIGEKTRIFSSQLRAELHCATPIIYRFVFIHYHGFISCAITIFSSTFQLNIVHLILTSFVIWLQPGPGFRVAPR